MSTYHVIHQHQQHAQICIYLGSLPFSGSNLFQPINLYHRQSHLYLALISTFEMGPVVTRLAGLFGLQRIHVDSDGFLVPSTKRLLICDRNKHKVI